MKQRKRTLNPDFFHNQLLSDLEDKYPRIGYLFQDLWCLAQPNKDKEGLLRDIPMLIHSLTFPYKPEIDVDNYLKILHEHKFLVRFSLKNERFIWIPGFKLHQPIHPHESKLLISIPKEVKNVITMSLQCNDGLLHPKGSSSNRGRGRDRGSEKPKIKTFDDIPEDKKAELKADYPKIDFDKEFKKCRDWWAGGKKELKRPVSALRNWLDNAEKFRQQNTPDDLSTKEHLKKAYGH